MAVVTSDGQRSVTFAVMPLTMDQALDAITTGLHHLGRTATVDLLRPGLPPEQTRADLHERGLVPSDELVQLYAWHDGTDGPAGTLLDDMHLFPGFYFLPPWRRR